MTNPRRARNFFIIVIFFAIIFFAKNAFAETPSVIINEIMWTGSPYSTSDEWIELKNTSDSDIDITGWIIEKAGTSGSSISLITTNDDSKPSLDKKYIIKAGGYFIISNYDKLNPSCILNITPDFVDSSISLSNTGNSNLVLKNNLSETIDIAPSDPWPAGDNIKKSSMERVEGYPTDSENAWQDSTLQVNLKENLIFATPGAENSRVVVPDPDPDPDPIPIPDPSESCIKINEMMPNPIGDDSQNEWIELYNICDREINIGGWYLDDIEGGSKVFQLADSTIIGPHGYLVFYASETKIALNNDADSARLLSSSLKVLDELHYDKVIENYSYAKIGDSFVLSSCPTPGSENKLCTIDEHPDLPKVENISDLGTHKNEEVSITGTVNSLPGDFSSQYFYIEDSSGGTQIYNYNKLFPDLKNGDSVNVFGTISDTSFLRLRTTDAGNIVINSSGTLTPLSIKISEINSLLQGKLVSIKGLVTKVYSDYLVLKDQDYEINIEIKNRDKLDFLSIKPYDIIQVTGVIYLTSGGSISVLPRFPTDIQILDKSVGGYDYIPMMENIGQVYEQPDKSIVKISGFVNSLPGTVAVQYFYIEDSSGAIAIYNYYKQFPALRIGDKIEIIGTYDKKYGRIKIEGQDSIMIVESDYYLIPQDVLQIVQSENIGRLVFIEGIINKKTSGKLYIDYGEQSIVIYLRSFSGIKSGDFKVGDWVKIAGILKDYTGEFRIIPRGVFDILSHIKYVKQKVSVLKSSKKTSFVKSAKATSTISVNSQKSIEKTPDMNYNSAYLVLVLLIAQIILFYVIYKRPS